MIGCLAVLAYFARVAADWDWLVAVGDHVRRTGQVPDHVPYAVAPTEGWHNVPVLAELLASWVDLLGAASGAVLLHLAIVLTALLVLAASARGRGASDARTAVLLVVLVLGALPALALVRLQSFSLVMFAVLLALLWREDRRPTRAVWWVPALVALWSNLHGAALLGLCVAGAYLLFGRLRQRQAESVAVGVASVVALCLTPQGWHTAAYYASVLDNEAAARGEGLWARPELSQPFDVLMIGAAVVLALVALRRRRRRRLWQYVALLGLTVATAEAARHGVWLLFFLFMLATDGPEDRARPAGRPEGGRSLAPVALAGSVSAVVVAALVIGRGDEVASVDPAVVRAVVAEVGDKVVLAPAPLVESLAVSGARVWAGNPLDAFEPEAQGAYLDFVAGQPGMEAAVRASDLVVVVEGSASDRGVQALGWELERRDLPGEYVAYTRP